MARRLFTLLSALSLLAGCSGSPASNRSQHAAAPSPQTQVDQVVSKRKRAPRMPVEEVVAELEAAPAWVSLGRKDDAARDRLLDCLTRVAAQDPEVVRAAVAAYIAAASDGYEAFARGRNVYILNRLIFAVPDKGRQWDVRGPPGKPIWPLEPSVSGVTLGLHGPFKGPFYNALAEFDALRELYGIRPLGE